MARETRGPARVEPCEGPRPTGKGTVFYRSAGACPPRVSGRPQHGEGQALALRGRGPFSPKKPSRYRSAGPLGCHTRIRAGFPRDVERYMKHPQLNLAGRGLLYGARVPAPSHSLKFISSCTSSRERDAITSHEVTRLLKSTAFAESPRLS